MLASAQGTRLLPRSGVAPPRIPATTLGAFFCSSALCGLLVLLLALPRPPTLPLGGGRPQSGLVGRFGRTLSPGLHGKVLGVISQFAAS